MASARWTVAAPENLPMDRASGRGKSRRTVSSGRSLINLHPPYCDDRYQPEYIARYVYQRSQTVAPPEPTISAVAQSHPAPGQPARASGIVTRLPSCGGRGVADGQPDGPVAEIGHEVEPSAEGLDVAGDDLEGSDLAVLDRS